MSGVGPGQAVRGFIAEAANPFDPVAEGYPPSNPTEGFTEKNVNFAGIITGIPAGGGEQLDLYCIDIFTQTFAGLGYGLGTWDAANVPNAGYIARVLEEYYPTTEEPASLADPDAKAAAVQAAIWFFSDRYVLNSTDGVYAATVAIVEQVRAQGPLVDPSPPSLTLTPSHLSGPAHAVLGPFTVSTGAEQATVTATGANMFSDPAGTAPIPNGAAVPSGQQIWLRSTAGQANATLQATATATVPTGNVYLYNGAGEVTAAQSLVMAGTTTLSTTVQATAEFRERPTPEEPNYEVEKLQVIKGSGAAYTKSELTGEVGDVVDYEVIVRNTGNVAIKFAPLTDENCSNIAPSGATEVPAGGSEVFTCEHALASSGSWTNEASIEGAGKTKPSNAVTVIVPAQIVKAQCTISESAIVLHGVLGSKRKTFAVRVPALGIKEITFYLDGRKIKTLTSSQASNGEFKIKIDPRKLSYGAHRVSVKIVTSESTCAAIARSAVFVHPKPAQVKPRFTG
jgi:hypothetical protein